MDHASRAELTQALLSVSEFETHIKDWSRQNEDRDIIYNRLLQSLTNANEEIKRLGRNLASETISRNQYQIQNDELVARNNYYERRAASNPYVIVLVDGDGAKFEDSLVRDGEAGGTQAANKLKKQVDNKLRGTVIEDSVEVFTRVYANFRGLGKTLLQSGLIRFSDDMHKFARGFTNTRPGFDFVDVDYGKENADSKIRHLLNWHYKDERCRKIFLVACHDAGYLHDLRPLLGDDADRIVLVETTPAPAAFKTLGLSITHFDGVFRDAPLELMEGFDAPSSPVQSMPNHARVPTPPQIPVATVSSAERRGSFEQRPDSYANIGGDNTKRNFVISKGKRRKPAQINLNEDGNRIDAPIQDTANPEAKASFREKLARAKKTAFCNRHYLEGGCELGLNCNMEHSMVLTPEEITVLRFKARTGPCTQGPKCIEILCSRGHHCPLDPDCRRRDCQFKSSWFGDMHLTRDKMKAVKRRMEGDTFPEYI